MFRKVVQKTLARYAITSLVILSLLLCLGFGNGYLSFSDITGTPNGTKFLRDDLSWQVTTGTSAGAPVWVAASNATSYEDTFAVASGGTVCDGTNDERDIVDACTTAGTTGVVILSSGTFNIDAALSVLGNTIIGQGSGERSSGTTLAITGTDYGITLGNVNATSGKMADIRHCRITTPASFADVALKMSYTRTVDGQDFLGDVAIQANNSAVFVNSPDQTAGSIGFQLISAASLPFSMNHFGSLFVSGFEKGVHIKAANDSSSCYINGNIFDSIIVKHSSYLVTLESAGTVDIRASVSGNIFTAMQLQPKLQAGYYGVHAIQLITTPLSMSWNWFESVWIWDWDAGGTDYVIHCDDNTVDNYFIGLYPNTGDATGYKDGVNNYNTFTRRN